MKNCYRARIFGATSSAGEYDAARNRLPAERNRNLPTSEAGNLILDLLRLKKVPEKRQCKRADRKNGLPLVFTNLCTDDSTDAKTYSLFGASAAGASSFGASVAGASVAGA